MERNQHQVQGMRLPAVPRRRQMLLPLLGIFVSVFTAVFVALAISAGARRGVGDGNALSGEILRDVGRGPDDCSAHG